MRYRLEVRLTGGDVGSRVVIRWRRPAGNQPAAQAGTAPGEVATAPGEVADVLGILEAADDAAFSVRRADGELVVIPRDRALGAKTIPPAPLRRRKPERREP